MNRLRENPHFKIAAFVLGLCFILFAFHFAAHLEHAGEETPIHECFVCFLTGFLLIALFLISALLGGDKNKTYFGTADRPLFHTLRLAPSISRRGPPR